MESKVILVYFDKGVSKPGLKQTEFFLNSFADGYEVRRVCADEISQGALSSPPKLLVIPGGEDRFYDNALRGAGNDEIKKFVDGGGRLLGICGGAYYGCREIEFAYGSNDAIVSKRDLGFFDGVAFGPLFKPYVSQSEVGASAELMRQTSNSQSFYAYYNGGCGFRMERDYDSVKVLAYYEKIYNVPAVIQCSVGLGKVILSGVHFEFSPDLMDPNIQLLAPIAEKIRQTLPELSSFSRYVIDALLTTDV
jgi:biotin--protein ligase